MFFFFNDTATTEIYTLSLHDALPIFLTHTEDLDDEEVDEVVVFVKKNFGSITDHRRILENIWDDPVDCSAYLQQISLRSEEHTSELQSRQYLVCRLLLEKKKKNRLDTIYREDIVVTISNKTLYSLDSVIQIRYNKVIS